MFVGMFSQVGTYVQAYVCMYLPTHDSGFCSYTDLKCPPTPTQPVFSLSGGRPRALGASGSSARFHVTLPPLSSSLSLLTHCVHTMSQTTEGL